MLILVTDDLGVQTPINPGNIDLIDRAWPDKNICTIWFSSGETLDVQGEPLTVYKEINRKLTGKQDANS